MRYCTFCGSELTTGGCPKWDCSSKRQTLSTQPIAPTLVAAPASPPRVPPTPEVVIEALNEMENAVVEWVQNSEALSARTLNARAALLALYVPPSVRVEDVNTLMRAVALAFADNTAYAKVPLSVADRIQRALTPRPDPTPETRDNG